MLASEEEQQLSVLTLCFNQTKSQLYIGTSSGFRIQRLDDGRITSARDRNPDRFTESESCEGGFAYIAPLFSTHTIALVGSANNPRFTSTKVLVWDEHSGVITNRLRFRSEVKSVMMRRDYVVIILEASVYVYTMSTMQPYTQYNTFRNEHGVGAISYQTDKFILATLDTAAGYVRVENLYTREVKRAPLHDNPISILTLDYSGEVGASASEQGTIIRIFNCDTLEVMHEFRRGSRPACISSLTFSLSLKYLVGSSDHGTLHIWQVQKADAGYFSGFVKSFMPTSFSYERSIAKLNLPTTSKYRSRYTTVRGPVCCFTSESESGIELMVANLDGMLYKCAFDPRVGTLLIKETITYLDTQEAEQREWVSM